MNELNVYGLIEKIDKNDKDNIKLRYELEKEVRKLIYFRDMICDLPTCNDCVNKECGVRPRIGETVRYNCHLHIKEDE